MDRRPLPRPTNAQLAILTVLWELGPATVRQVHEALPAAARRGYTTTLKLMQIMAERGLVERDESARSHVYSAAVERGRLQDTLVGDLLSKAFGGSAAKLAIRALSTTPTSLRPFPHRSAYPVRTRCVRPAMRSSISAASSASRGFPSTVSWSTTSVSAARTQSPSDASFATAFALSRARRCVCASGDSPGRAISSTAGRAISNSKPSARSRSRRRGELLARISFVAAALADIRQPGGGGLRGAR